MKLRNKKTGEIITCGAIDALDLDMKSMGYFRNYGYSSLAELNEDWEDYEEQTKFYMIERNGEVSSRFITHDSYTEKFKAIGNYFETKEEAEKAVEKLKAWERLKDKGFKFKTWYGGSKNIDYEITSLENETYIPRQICDDLDLLFGGEE